MIFARGAAVQIKISSAAKAGREKDVLCGTAEAVP
jgi:hypothetical protein